MLGLFVLVACWAAGAFVSSLAVTAIAGYGPGMRARCLTGDAGGDVLFVFAWPVAWPLYGLWLLLRLLRPRGRAR